MLLVYLAFSTSTVLPTAGQLALAIELAVIGPGDVIDFFVRPLPFAVCPPFDDLDAIKIGAIRITQARTSKRGDFALPALRQDHRP